MCGNPGAACWGGSLVELGSAPGKSNGDQFRFSSRTRGEAPCTNNMFPSAWSTRVCSTAILAIARRHGRAFNGISKPAVGRRCRFIRNHEIHIRPLLGSLTVIVSALPAAALVLNSWLSRVFFNYPPPLPEKNYHSLKSLYRASLGDTRESSKWALEPPIANFGDEQWKNTPSTDWHQEVVMSEYPFSFKFF